MYLRDKVFQLGRSATNTLMVSRQELARIQPAQSVGRASLHLSAPVCTDILLEYVSVLSASIIMDNLNSNNLKYIIQWLLTRHQGKQEFGRAGLYILPNDTYWLLTSLLINYFNTEGRQRDPTFFIIILESTK